MAFWGGYSPLAAAAASAQVLPETVSPSAGSAAITGFAPAVLVGMTAALGAGSVGVESTGWATAKVETAVNNGGGSGGLLLALNTLLEAPAGITAAPSTGVLTIAGQQVSLSLDVNTQPSAGNATLTGYAPSLGGAASVSPESGGVSIQSTGWAVAKVETTVNNGGGSGGLLFALNSLLIPQNAVTPSSGGVTITGYAPTITGNSLRLPSTGSLSLAGYSPSLGGAASVTPSAGALSFTGYAPTIPSTDFGGGYGGLLAALSLNFEPQSERAPSSGAVSLTGHAPTLSRTGGSSGSGLLAALGSLTEAASLTGQYRPSSGSLSLTGYAPSITRVINDLGWDEFESGPSTVSGTGTKGAVYDPKLSFPTTGSLSLTGYAPSLLRAQIASPFVGGLSLVGYQPSLSRNFVVAPSTGNISATGSAGYGYGLLRYGRDVYGVTRYEYVAANSGPQTGQVTLIGYRPTVLQQLIVLPSSGSVGITGYHTIIPSTVTPSTGALAVVGYAPQTELASPGRLPLSGAVGISGYSPTIVRGYTNLSSVWQMGRAFIEVYTDVSASFFAVSGNSTVTFDLGTEVADGDFISGNATVTFRQWANQTVTTNIWTDQGTASSVWTELTPNTDVWNG